MGFKNKILLVIIILHIFLTCKKNFMYRLWNWVLKKIKKKFKKKGCFSSSVPKKNASRQITALVYRAPTLDQNKTYNYR